VVAIERERERHTHISPVRHETLKKNTTPWYRIVLETMIFNR